MKFHYSPGILVRLNINKLKKGEAYVVLKKLKKIKKFFIYQTMEI